MVLIKVIGSRLAMCISVGIIVCKRWQHLCCSHLGYINVIGNRLAMCMSVGIIVCKRWQHLRCSHGLHQCDRQQTYYFHVRWHDFMQGRVTSTLNPWNMIDSRLYMYTSEAIMLCIIDLECRLL